MLKIFYLIVVTIGIILILTGCPDSIGNPRDIIFPDSNISYTGQVEPFLNLTCAFSNCHGNYPMNNNIYLNDYFKMMNTPGLIIPGNPDGSLLMQILDKTKPHLTYYEESNITSNHIKGMRKWILEGANLKNK